ncbi:MAG: hypothetical protein U1G08_12695 [Verrucomicrobiota bacterium]
MKPPPPVAMVHRMQPMIAGLPISRRNWLRTGAALAGGACFNRFPILAADPSSRPLRPANLSESLPTPDFHRPLDAKLASMKGSSDPLIAKKYMVLHDEALLHYEHLKLTPTNDLRVLSKTSDFVLKPGTHPAYFDQPFEKQKIKRIEHFKEYYDYAPDPDPKVTAFWVDFANLDLGGGVFTHGFVQEEIMCCEVPELANASALSSSLHTRYPGREVLAGSPTPIVLMGVHRVVEFFSDRPGHPYGTEEFRALDINRPKDYLRRLDPAVQFNVLAMAAPHLSESTPEQQFGRDTLHDLFNTFVAGFTLADDAAKSEKRYATINTGKIGSGDFKNNPNVVYVLQGLAAEFVGVNLRFWGYEDAEAKRAEHYYDAIRRQVTFGVTTVIGVLEVAHQVLKAALVEDLVPHENHLEGNLYGEPDATYQVHTSTDLQNWAEGQKVKLGKEPVTLTVPIPAGGGRVFLRADTL